MLDPRYTFFDLYFFQPELFVNPFDFASLNTMVTTACPKAVGQEDQDTWIAKMKIARLPKRLRKFGLWFYTAP